MIVRNNTIVANSIGYLEFVGAGLNRIVNNIIAFNRSWGVMVGPGTGYEVSFNDVFANPSGNYVLNTGAGFVLPYLPSPGTGEISVDPLFRNPSISDYRLARDSPAVDAGTNADAPADDVLGVRRPQDGNFDGSSIVDMGAFERLGPDAIPPTVTCAARPAVLSPANHELVAVTVTVSVEDAESGPAGFTLLSATSSEPDQGLGRRDRPNDVQGFDVGTNDTEGLLRAERAARGSGRTYTLTYEGRDRAGNSAVCGATVFVPRHTRW